MTPGENGKWSSIGGLPLSKIEAEGKLRRHQGEKRNCLNRGEPRQEDGLGMAVQEKKSRQNQKVRGKEEKHMTDPDSGDQEEGRRSYRGRKREFRGGKPGDNEKMRSRQGGRTI